MPVTELVISASQQMVSRYVLWEVNPVPTSPPVNHGSYKATFAVRGVGIGQITGFAPMDMAFGPIPLGGSFSWTQGTGTGKVVFTLSVAADGTISLQQTTGTAASKAYIFLHIV
jgi:hypothetical protein